MNLSGTENNGFIIWVGFIHKNLNPFGFALLDFNDFIEICFIRNIVLMRPVNQIIEFKQIVGRGTRLFDGKEFFTIYDFVS
jgi:hypothetical protein